MKTFTPSFFITLCLLLWVTPQKSQAQEKPSENSPVIELTTVPGKEIILSIQGGTEEFPLFIELAPKQYTRLTENYNSWIANKYKALDKKVRIHGAVTTLAFSDQDDKDAITGLSVVNHPTIVSIYGSKNKLTRMEISKCPSLTFLACYENSLAELILNSCPNLGTLQCGANELTALNLQSFTQLKELECYNNKLKELDLSGCDMLTKVDCAGNQLTLLDVSMCNELIMLDCFTNKLETLLIPENRESLIALSIYENNLDACALNAVYQMLNSLDQPKNLYNVNNPGCFTANSKIATDKHWIVEAMGDASANCPGTSTEAIDTNEGWRVWTSEGVLCWEGNQACLSLFDAEGKLVAEWRQAQGQATLPRGLYVVQSSKTSRKVVVL